MSWHSEALRQKIAPSSQGDHCVLRGADYVHKDNTQNRNVTFRGDILRVGFTAKKKALSGV